MNRDLKSLADAFGVRPSDVCYVWPLYEPPDFDVAAFCAVCHGGLAEKADVVCLWCREGWAFPDAFGAAFEARLDRVLSEKRLDDEARCKERDRERDERVRPPADWSRDVDLVVRSTRTPLGRAANRWRYHG